MARKNQGLSSEEAQRIGYPSVALLLMTGAFILTKTGRDALYFQRNGFFDLPWAYLGMAFLAVPLAIIVLTLMRLLGRRGVRVASPIVMAILQGVFYLLAKPGGGWVMTAFFMLIPLIYGGSFSMAWLLGAELLDETPRERLATAYATIGAASMLGGVGGGIIAKLLAPHLDPQVFILLGAAGLVSSAAVMAVAQVRFPALVMHGDRSGPSPESKGGIMPPFAKIFATLKERYVRSLLAITITAALVGILIEFQFYLVVAASGSGSRENSNFFANFYIVLTGAALVLQIVAMPALQRWIGVNGSLLILPSALFSGAMVLALSASGFGRTALRIAEGGLKSSIHRSNWEQAYLPLARSHRLIVKVMVDGMGKHLAEGLAAALLLVWLKLVVGDRDLVGLDISWITYLIVGGAFLWVTFTLGLGHCLEPQHRAELRDRRFRLNIPLPDS